MDYRLGPLKGNRMLISAVGKAVNGLTDLLGVGDAEAFQDGSGQNAEPHFDLVQPGGMGRCVVEMHRWMAGQPPIVLRFVSVKVVQYDMEFHVRILGNDAVHEVQELPSTSTPVVRHPDDPTVHLPMRVVFTDYMPIFVEEICHALRRHR